MTTHAKATLEITSWKEETYAELGNGSKCTRAHVTQRFRGDIEGESCVEYLLMNPDETYAFYVGMQRVVGRIGERSGSFVLQTNGCYSEGKPSEDWFVVPGSGTGELKGLGGKGGYRPPAGEVIEATLEYDFDLSSSRGA
jgi:hypothetical protein